MFCVSAYSGWGPVCPCSNLHRDVCIMAEQWAFTCSALASERQAAQQLQGRKAWGVARAELERQLAQQRRSAEADKAASLQSLKDLFQRCCHALTVPFSDCVNPVHHQKNSKALPSQGACWVSAFKICCNPVHKLIATAV